THQVGLFVHSVAKNGEDEVAFEARYRNGLLGSARGRQNKTNDPNAQHTHFFTYLDQHSVGIGESAAGWRCHLVPGGQGHLGTVLRPDLLQFLSGQDVSSDFEPATHEGLDGGNGSSSGLTVKKAAIPEEHHPFLGKCWL